MKKALPKLLFYYSAVASFLITVSTIFTSYTLGPVIFATLFLPVTAYFIIEFFKQMRGEGSNAGSGPKKAEVIVTVALFLLLMGLGLKNIYKNKQLTINNPQLTTSPPPLVFKTQPSPTPTTSTTITIDIIDGSTSINIREKPTIYSDKVGEAKNRDVFEYTKKEMGWYEIRMDTGLIGFISAKYARENQPK